MCVPIGLWMQTNEIVDAVVVNMAAALFHIVDMHSYTSIFFFFRFMMTSTSFMMIILVLLPIYSWSATSTVATNLNAANLDGLKSQFQTAMKSLSDVASLHYTLAGSKELGVQPPDSFCNDIKRLVEKSNIESIFHATEAARALTNCKVRFKEIN